MGIHTSTFEKDVAYMPVPLSPRMLTERHIRFLANPGLIRVQKYRGSDHIVVPTVALVGDIVVHASNAELPEFVPAEELAITPSAWNGRPILGDHPRITEENVSANTPGILERFCFGTTFGAKFENKRLTVEAWMDPLRAQTTGDAKTIERLQAGEVVEVSTGILLEAIEPVEGTYNGKKYFGVWRGIRSDHLAIGLNGARGACSVEAGCGANRTNSETTRRNVIYVVTENGVEERDMSVRAIDIPPPMKERDKPEETPKRSLRERFLALFQAFRMNADDTTDIDLREKLDAALRATEPGYLGVDYVVPGEELVVYACAPSDAIQYFQRGYSLSDGGVTLKDDRIEGQMARKFEPLRAASESSSTTESQPTTAPGDSPSGNQQPPCGCANKGETVMTKEQRAQLTKALIDGGKFKESDRALLDAASDDAIRALVGEKDGGKDGGKPGETENKPNEKKDEPPTRTTNPLPGEVKPVEENPKQAKENVLAVLRSLSEDEYLGAAPSSIREAVDEKKARDLAERSQLTEAITKAVGTAYSKADLDAMSMPALRQLSTAVKVSPIVDFSGRGVPRTNATDNGGFAPPPPSLHERVRMNRGEKVETAAK